MYTSIACKHRLCRHLKQTISVNASSARSTVDAADSTAIANSGSQLHELVKSSPLIESGGTNTAETLNGENVSVKFSHGAMDVQSVVAAAKCRQQAMVTIQNVSRSTCNLSNRQPPKTRRRQKYDCNRWREGESGNEKLRNTTRSCRQCSRLKELFISVKLLLEDIERLKKVQ
jgi:hypothetical protein